MDSQSRSLIKALSYRMLGSTATSTIFLLLTGNLTISLSAGVLDCLAKIALYFLHERIWDRIPFGRPKAHQYEI